MPPARLDGDGAWHRRDRSPLGPSSGDDPPGGNHCVDGYRADSAERRAWARKLRGSKIERSTRLRSEVEDRLGMGWSPEQIAGRMEQEGSEHTISAESIYRHVYSPNGRRAGLPRLLAQRKAKRGRRRRNGQREPSIPNRMPIHQRPTKAHLRSQTGKAI